MKKIIIVALFGLFMCVPVKSAVPEIEQLKQIDKTISQMRQLYRKYKVINDGLEVEWENEIITLSAEQQTAIKARLVNDYQTLKAQLKILVNDL